jgi:O-methyltransferase
LDTDWYESTKLELEILYPILHKDGILILDDYGYWQGARQAVDEYFDKGNIRVFLHRVDNSGRIVVGGGATNAN